MRNVRIRGLKATVRNLKKIDKKISGPIRKKMLTDMGTRTKGYAQRIIQANAVSSGTLLKGMHYRIFPDRVSIWNDAGRYAYSWERGMRPHFIHRNMISEAGYTVGEWMDSKGFNPLRNYVLVGAGTPLGSGIRFMQIASEKMQKGMPSLLKKYARMIK